MRRRLSRNLITLLILSVLVGCASRPLVSPAGVPGDALWAGGSDGGVWIVCRDINPGKEAFFCSVYGENGSLWREGTWEVESARDNSGANSAEIPYSAQRIRETGYSFYDGRHIKLLNGVFLKRVS